MTTKIDKNLEHLFDNKTNTDETLREKLLDAMIPGYQAEFDPDEAEIVGAFVEDALSEDDAVDSSTDLIFKED